METVVVGINAFFGILLMIWALHSIQTEQILGSIWSGVHYIQKEKNPKKYWMNVGWMMGIGVTLLLLSIIMYLFGKL